MIANLDVDKLSVEECRILIDRLSDRIDQTEQDLKLTDFERRIIDERLERLRIHPEKTISMDEFRNFAEKLRVNRSGLAINCCLT